VPILTDEVTTFITELTVAQHTDVVLDEMEGRAQLHGFPIIGRACGRLLELLARAIGARRVMELGSGYGYSAYWFARAVGEGGAVVCTDGDATNATDAQRYLTAAGLWDRVEFHVGDALTSFAAQDGDFDIVYNDVDKDGYPDCWVAARDRIRVGGLYLCDNVLWSGRVATGEPTPNMPGWTEAIIEHDKMVAGDPRFVSQIVPLRDGVLVALRVS